MPSVDLVFGGVKTSALKHVLEDAKRIIIVSGFVTAKGLAEVRKPILDCAKRGGHVTLFFGIDRAGIASPQLVLELGNLLAKAGSKLEVSLLVESARSFLHAKIFAASKTGSAEILVGSFNLTGGGLSTNHEFAAHIRGKGGQFFDDLAAFINSIPDRKQLTAENVADVAKALEPSSTEAQDPKVREERRQQAQERIDKLIAALSTSAKVVLGESQVVQRRESLLRAGRFWAYQFDIEKLSIPSGLSAIYEQGLLRKEKTQAAGTARMKVPTTVTATFPLLPPTWQNVFRRLSTRLSKAVSAFGFETPYGYWVPDALLPLLNERVKKIASSVPNGAEIEEQLRKFVNRHKEELEETTRQILANATKDGVQPPSLWKAVRDPDLAEIREKYRTRDEVGWEGSDDAKAVSAIIGKRLMAVKDKLDPALAIAKVRRVRPDLLSVPVDFNDEVVQHLLECMVWSVAEDRGVRNTRSVVRSLSRRLPDVKAALPELQSLSEALLERSDGAERFFFALFGDPPYWSAVTDEGDDEDA